MRALLHQSGFTIIELMIVVGIIGLLVTIAVPMYDRYTARVRQTEAKIGLSAIYTAEKGFYSEYSAYISSFDAVHWTPEASRRFYSIGWGSTMAGTVTAYAGTYGTPTWDKANVPPQFGCSPPASYASLPARTQTDFQMFTVGAAGEVRLNTGCDVWTMNQDKAVSNSVVGI